MTSALPNVPRSESILYLLVLYEKILWEKKVHIIRPFRMECCWVLKYSYLITRCIGPYCVTANQIQSSCYIYNDLVPSCAFLMGNFQVNSLVLVTQKVLINLALIS